MGINERLIRTSIFRLTKEGWLTAEKVGRRSYYSLTGTGRRRFEKAFKRVYSASLPAWNGVDAGAAVAARCRQAQGRA
jgi:phenylacetic acid degradation operon negative regulatory protein